VEKDVILKETGESAKPEGFIPKNSKSVNTSSVLITTISYPKPRKTICDIYRFLPQSFPSPFHAATNILGEENIIVREI
jgi:hypothetical protein